MKEVEKESFNHQEFQKEENKDKYYVTFNAGSEGINGVADLRDLKSNKLGKLTCMRGTVTKTTEVRP